MRRFGQRGEGRIGCILWLAVVIIAVMIAVKVVPVKLTDVEFGDYIEEQAQFAGRTSGETLRARILKKAKELEIPLEKKNLKVKKSMSNVEIEASYVVTLDFGFYQHDLKLDHEISRKLFIM